MVHAPANLRARHALEGNGLALAVVERVFVRQLDDALQGFVIEGHRAILLGIDKLDFAALHRLQTGNGLQQLLLTAARDARDAEDFAAVYREAHVPNGAAAVLAFGREASDEQARGGVHGRVALDVQADLFADHHFGQLALAGLGGFHRAHALALAQNRHAVGNGEHLVQLMRDDDDGLAVRLHSSKHVEQARDFLRSEHRRGLVQNQNIRAAVEHFDDFDRLLFGYGHIVNSLLRLDMEAVLFGDFRHLLVDLLQVVASLFLQAEHDVLRSRKQVHQLEMLMNHADFQRVRVLGRADDYLPAVHKNLPLVGIVNSGEHIHQGRLAAAVFAQNGENFSLIHIQVHRIVRDDTAESLGNAPHAHSDLLLHGLPSA